MTKDGKGQKTCEALVRIINIIIKKLNARLILSDTYDVDLDGVRNAHIGAPMLKLISQENGIKEDVTKLAVDKLQSNSEHYDVDLLVTMDAKSFAGSKSTKYVSYQMPHAAWIFRSFPKIDGVKAKEEHVAENIIAACH